MKIVFVTSGYLPFPPKNGGAVENLLLNLVSENSKLKFHDFEIYSIYSKAIKNVTFENTKCKYIKISPIIKALDYFIYLFFRIFKKKSKLISYRFILQRFCFLKKVAKRINGEDIDRLVLENNVIMFKVLKYRDNEEKFMSKTIYHAHNDLGKTLGYEKYLSKCYKIIAISKYIEMNYSNYNANIDVLLNTVDINKINKAITFDDKKALFEKWGLNFDYTTIVFVGRLTYEKGIYHLLKSLIGLKNYNLLIVGASFYKTNVKSSFEKELREICSKLEGNICFTGYIDYEQIYKVYHLADLCVLPSVWNEPCGLSIIEAIASGVPLITTNVGGIPEVVNESTILLENDSKLIDNIHSEIKKLLDNKNILKDLKLRAKIGKSNIVTLEDYYKKFDKIIN